MRPPRKKWPNCFSRSLPRRRSKTLRLRICGEEELAAGRDREQHAEMGPEECFWGDAGAGCRPASAERIRSEGCNQATANAGREASFAVRLESVQAREVERNSLCA